MNSFFEMFIAFSRCQKLQPDSEEALITLKNYCNADVYKACILLIKIPNMIRKIVYMTRSFWATEDK